MAWNKFEAGLPGEAGPGMEMGQRQCAEKGTEGQMRGNKVSGETGRRKRETWQRWKRELKEGPGTREPSTERQRAAEGGETQGRGSTQEAE